MQVQKHPWQGFGPVDAPFRVELTHKRQHLFASGFCPAIGLVAMGLAEYLQSGANCLETFF
jgi:hypothetical protein